MASAKVLVTNRLSQVLNVTLADEKGKHYTKSLLPKSVTKLNASELTEVVFNLVQHGHLALNAVEEKQAAKPAPAPKFAAKKAESAEL